MSGIFLNCDNIYEALKAESEKRGLTVEEVLRKSGLDPYMTKKKWSEKEPKTILAIRNIEEFFSNHDTLKQTETT